MDRETSGSEGTRHGAGGRHGAGALPDSGIGTRVLRARGWRGWTVLGGRRRDVVVDFAAGEVRRGRVAMRIAELRDVEVGAGVLGLSDGRRWICADLLRYRDAAGPLARAAGGLSAAASQLIYDLHVAARADSAAAPEGDRVFDVRSVVHVDVRSIVLTLLGLAFFVYYYGRDFAGGGQGLISAPGLAAFAGLVAAGAAWLFIWRALARLRLDGEGVSWRRGLMWRRLAWGEVDAMRQQGLELELRGGRRRMTAHLEILRVSGAPLLLRRGVRTALTPLGARFLQHLRERVPVEAAPQIAAGRWERLVGRLWLAVIGGANVVLFALSRPEGLWWRQPRNHWEAEVITRRLGELGARTAAAFSEPWRLFASLFLHGDVFHLCVNLLVLATVAPWLGRIFGWTRATFLYLGAGTLGNALAQWSNSWPGVLGQAGAPPSVGASTAILGVVGALLGGIYRRPESVPLAVRERLRWGIIVVMGLTLASGLVVTFIDNRAHLGGFIAGFVLAWPIPPRRVR